jgi:hypothetical protein
MLKKTVKVAFTEVVTYEVLIDVDADLAPADVLGLEGLFQMVTSQCPGFAKDGKVEEREFDSVVEVGPAEVKEARPAIKFPESSLDWELYQEQKSKRATDTAAKELTASLKKAIKALLGHIRFLGLRNPHQIKAVLDLTFREHMAPTMRAHAEVGADDTEPRGVALQAMNDAVKKEIGRVGERIPELGEI